MKSLFKDFKKSSKKDWLTKVEKDLKGKPIENLNWKINEDLVVSPFAHPDDLKELPYSANRVWYSYVIELERCAIKKQSNNQTLRKGQEE